MEPREARRRAAQAVFDGARSLQQRNRVGQFATPSQLASAIASEALVLLGEGPVRFGEPSVGSGAFYGALLRSGAEVESAWGVELDPELAGICREIWSGQLTVHTGDFTQSRGLRANLILANPPYVRHHHLTRGEKVRLRARVQEETGVRLSGLAGLYVYFMLPGTAALEPDGVAAWLVPSEWMRVGYGRPLRDWLAGSVRVERVHVFDANDEQFGDALVSSSVVFVRRAPPGSEVVFSRGGTLARPDESVLVATAELLAAERWPPSPVVTGPVLGDWFSVRRGVATGANQFFVLTRARADELGLPSDALKPVLPSPRELEDDVIEGDGELFLLDWSGPASGALREYLEQGEAAGLPDRYLLSRRKPWYRQERRDPAPFVIAYMGRKSPLRVFWNKAGRLATNRWLLLYPKEGIGTEAAWRALRSLDPADALTFGRQYGGGLNKLEPSELLRLPLRV